VSTNETYMSLWNFMEISEKQHLMKQFLKQHGDHFNKEDFLRFLARRYAESRPESRMLERQSGRPRKSGRNEHGKSSSAESA